MTLIENGEVFRVHFGKVFKSPAIAKYGIWTLLDQQNEKEALRFEPTDEEFKAAIFRSPNDKSPGIDGVVPEFL